MQKRERGKRVWESERERERERVADCRDATLITSGLDKKRSWRKKRIKEKNEVGRG